MVLYCGPSDVDVSDDVRIWNDSIAINPMDIVRSD